MPLGLTAMPMVMQMRRCPIGSVDTSCSRPYTNSKSISSHGMTASSPGAAVPPRRGRCWSALYYHYREIMIIYHYHYHYQFVLFVFACLCSRLFVFVQQTEHCPFCSCLLVFVPVCLFLFNKRNTCSFCSCLLAASGFTAFLSGFGALLTNRIPFFRIMVNALQREVKIPCQLHEMPLRSAAGSGAAECAGNAIDGECPLILLAGIAVGASLEFDLVASGLDSNANA